MDMEKLTDYITQALRSGLSIQQIMERLISAGWKQDIVNNALEQAIPKPQTVINSTVQNTNIKNENSSSAQGDIYNVSNNYSVSPNKDNLYNTSSQASSNINNNFNSVVAEPRSNKTKIVVVIVILAVLAGIGYLYTNFISKTKTGISPTIDQQLLKTDLTKYSKDSDGDSYPDFLEIAVGGNKDENLYTKCYGNNPCASAQIGSGDYTKDILIILDASGSMGLSLGSRTRMEEAKDAITRYINNSGENTRFGLMIYGHKGSNSTADKPLSCSSAEVIKQIGAFDKSSVSTALAGVSPVGWTNMGTAINAAIPAFSTSTAKKKEIILVSDGAETCDSKPEEAAKNAKNAGIKVGVIGFAVDTQASSQLTLIANAGGGGYSVANSADELFQKFEDTSENVQNWGNESTCLYNFLDTARLCYKEPHDKMVNYLYQEQTRLYSKEINQDEYDKIKELQSTLNNNYIEMINEEQNKVETRLNQTKDEAFGR